MGARLSVDLLKNGITVEQAQELVKIMQSKETLITLCGLSGNEATLDFSNQELGPGDAMHIANDISIMRTLITLNVRDNSTGQSDPLQLITELCNTKGIELDNDIESDSDCDY
jgi:hypothetical protein